MVQQVLRPALDLSPSLTPPFLLPSLCASPLVFQFTLAPLLPLWLAPNVRGDRVSKPILNEFFIKVHCAEKLVCIIGGGPDA